MKAVISLLVFIMSVPAFAAPRLACENEVTRLRTNAVLFRAVERSVEKYGEFGTRAPLELGRIFNVYQIQSCADRNSSFQGVSVHFKVEATNLDTDVTRVYTCLSQQKRYRLSSGRWGGWANTKTRCRVTREQRAADDFDRDERAPRPRDYYDGDAGNRIPDFRYEDRGDYDRDYGRGGPYYGGDDNGTGNNRGGSDNGGGYYDGDGDGDGGNGGRGYGDHEWRF